MGEAHALQDLTGILLLRFEYLFSVKIQVNNLGHVSWGVMGGEGNKLTIFEYGCATVQNWIDLKLVGWKPEIIKICTDRSDGIIRLCQVQALNYLIQTSCFFLKS